MRQQDSLLIIGSRGLLGSACHAHFAVRGYQHLLLPSRDEMNICDALAVKHYFERHRPKFVICAAGMVGGIQFNKRYPADLINTNLLMQLNVFKIAHDVGVERLIFFASSCMYPRECQQPMSESQLLTGGLEPTSQAYAVSKLAGLAQCMAYNQQYGEERFLTLIPNTIYGPGDDFNPETGHVIPALMARVHHAKIHQLPEVGLWGTGAARREFVHASDVASAVEFVLTGNQNIPVPLNIGNGKDCTIKELAEEIKSIVGYTGQFVWDKSKPDGAPQKLLDNTKITSMGWQAKVALRQGLEDMYVHYQAQQEKGVL